MKLCKDCRWMEPNDKHPEEALCLHKNSVWFAERSPVTGEVKPGKQIPCRMARGLAGTLRPLGIEMCGPDGKYWEPIAPPGFVA